MYDSGFRPVATLTEHPYIMIALLSSAISKRTRLDIFPTSSSPQCSEFY